MVTHLQINIDPIFPLFEEADLEIRDEFQRCSVYKKIEKGLIIANEGDDVNSFALVINGSVRIYKIGETGRGITLYRVQRGESCILTAACALSQISFPAYANVEDAIEIIVVPANVFRQWVNVYEIWRRYVFSLLAQRLSGILATIEEVAFRRVDVRLIEYLIHISQYKGLSIQKTHQEIARELGSAREVINRMLKDMESENLIILSRGVIQIKDILSLQKKRSMF